MTRPFDAVLWAAAVGATSWSCTGGSGPSRLRAPRCLVALGFLPLLVATLAYNRTSPAASPQFPITAADPLDTFGFGLRRLMPTFGDGRLHGRSRRSAARASSGLCLPLFLVGSYLGLVVAGVRRSGCGAATARTLALLALVVAFPVGYFFFWGMHVSASDDDRSAGRSTSSRCSARSCIFIATAVVSGVGTDAAVRHRAVSCARRGDRPVPVNRSAKNHRISEAQEPWRDGDRSAAGAQSLVFVQQSGRVPAAPQPVLVEHRPTSTGGCSTRSTRVAPDLDLIASRARARTPYLQKTSVPTNSRRPQRPSGHPARSRCSGSTWCAPGMRPCVHVGCPTRRVAGGRARRSTSATRSNSAWSPPIRRAGASYATDWTVAAARREHGDRRRPGVAGRATITTSRRATAESVAAASSRRPGRSIPYRIDGETAELLLPEPAGESPGVLNGEPGVDRGRSLPELRVQARAGRMHPVTPRGVRRRARRFRRPATRRLPGREAGTRASVFSPRVRSLSCE